VARLSLLAAVPLAACTHAVVPREGPVALGQVAAVNGPRVRPLAVVEDSRCPATMTCVWAGRITVRVAVILGSGTREMVLTLGEPAPVADGALTLAAVTPARGTHPVRQDAYRFTFAFQGGL
jgi:hypothetical protein